MLYPRDGEAPQLTDEDLHAGILEHLGGANDVLEGVKFAADDADEMSEAAIKKPRLDAEGVLAPALAQV